MTNLTKIEVQKRVLLDGKPLDLDKFNWDEETKTFSSRECYLVFDFANINNCTFDTGSDCTFKTGNRCAFKTYDNCTFDTGSRCTFNTGSDCTFDTGSDCTFKTGNRCAFKTYDNCTFDTGSRCTFNTGSDCTFDTGSDCTFKTYDNCAFKTGYNCTFNTGFNCTFDTGSDCVIVNRNVYEVILPKKGDIVHICPSKIKGHLVNGIHSITGKKSIIADEILSEIISKKNNVYKIKNHGKTEISYLIEIDRNNKKVYSHGNTIKEAKENLIYKLSDRDTSKYKDLTLKSILTKDEAIQCYMTITGACNTGTKYFIDNLDKVKTKYSIKEIIDLTEGQFGNREFQNFFNNLNKL